MPSVVWLNEAFEQTVESETLNEPDLCAGIKNPVEIRHCPAHRSKAGLGGTFDLYHRGRETANAFSPSPGIDPLDQPPAAWEAQQERPVPADSEAQGVTKDFLAALEVACLHRRAGLSGIDRLGHCLAHRQPHNRDVIRLPLMKGQETRCAVG